MKRLLALAALAAVQGWGQCVMCFRTAEAQSAARARLLNLGIVILGAPPFLILAGFCYVIYRRNHSYADGPSGESAPAMSPSAQTYSSPSQPAPPDPAPSLLPR